MGSMPSNFNAGANISLEMAGQNMQDYNVTDYTTDVITPFYVAMIFAVHAPLWVLNVGGNSLVIVSVYRDRSLRRPTYFLIGALAVADIFLPLFAYPPSMYAILVENQYTCSAGTRTYFFFPTYTCAAASFFHIIAITFERYIGVVKPLHYPRLITRRRIVAMVVVIWLTSFALAFLSLPLWRKIDDADRPVCLLPSASSLFSFAVFSCCMLGMIFLSIVYLHIYVIARRHWRLLQGQREKAATFRVADSLTKAEESEPDDSDSIDARGQLKATKTIGIIVAFFVICYFPMATRFLFEGIRSSMNLSRSKWIFIKRFSETFGLLNGAINPLVYARQNSTFRQAFKNTCKAFFETFVSPKSLSPRRESSPFLKTRTSISTDILL